MVKEYGLTEQTVHASNLLDTVDSMHHIGYYDNKIYFIILNSTTITLYYVPSADLNQAATSVTTLSSSYANIDSCFFHCTADGDMVIAIDSYNVSSYATDIKWSNDGGATFTAQARSGSSASFTRSRTIGINLAPDREMWIVRALLDTGGAITFNTAIVDGFTSASVGAGTIFPFGGTTGVDYLDAIYPTHVAYSDGTYTYWVFAAAIDSDTLRPFACWYDNDGIVDGGAITGYDIDDYVLPTSRSMKQNYCDYNYNTEELFILDSTQLLQDLNKSGSALRWTSSTYTNAICYKADYSFDYLLFDGRIVLHANTQDFLMAEQNINASAGMVNYFIDVSTNKIYELGLVTTTRFFQTYCTDEVERAQNCTFRTLTQPADNEYIGIYDDSSNLVIKGEAKNVTEENDIYSGRIKTLAENDLDKPITYTSSGAETAATAIGNIITAEFIYITAGTLTSSATTTTFSYPDKRPAREIITEIAHWDKKLWYLTPAYVLALNAGTIDSTKSFKSSDSKYPANFTHEVNNQQTGTVIGIGPGTVTTTVVKNLANGTLVYYFPNYTQGQMDTAIANIADTEYITQHQYSMNNMFGLLPLQVGTQLTFEYVLGSANIPEALMFTKIIQYDVINNYILRLVLHDVLFYRKTSLTPEQVFQYTTTVKTTADAALPKAGGTLTGAITIDAHDNTHTVIIPTTTNTNSIGSATKAFAGVYTRIVQSDATVTIQSGTNKDNYIKATGTGINYLYSANSGTAVVVFDQKAYNANPSANIGFRLIATSGGASGTVGYIYCSKLNATDGNYSSYMRFLTLLNGETASEVLRLATPVSAADSYIQITNGKAGTSDTIIESAGTANNLQLKAGTAKYVKTRGTSLEVKNVADDDYVDVNANDFVVSSPKVYEAGLAELLAIDDINDHSQLPPEIKRIVQNEIMRKEVRTESYIDEETKEESIREIEVKVLDHIEEKEAESLGSTIQWLKRALIEEHTEKIALEQRVQTLELQLKDINEKLKIITEIVINK